MSDFFLVVYDITHDKRRTKVADHLEALGRRVQYSVFEMYVAQENIPEIKKDLENHMNLEEDSLRIYSLCGSCQKKITVSGIGNITEPPGDVIIV